MYNTRKQSVLDESTRHVELLAALHDLRDSNKRSADALLECVAAVAKKSNDMYEMLEDAVQGIQESNASLRSSLKKMRTVNKQQQQQSLLADFGAKATTKSFMSSTLPPPTGEAGEKTPPGGAAQPPLDMDAVCADRVL